MPVVTTTTSHALVTDIRPYVRFDAVKCFTLKTHGSGYAGPRAQGRHLEGQNWQSVQQSHGRRPWIRERSVFVYSATMVCLADMAASHSQLRRISVVTSQR